MGLPKKYRLVKKTKLDGFVYYFVEAKSLLFPIWDSLPETITHDEAKCRVMYERIKKGESVSMVTLEETGWVW